jgi:hypothetical protein
MSNALLKNEKIRVPYRKARGFIVMNNLINYSCIA